MASSRKALLQQYAKVYFRGLAYTQGVTLNCDLLTPKFNAFVLCPTTHRVSLVTMGFSVVF